MAIKLYGMNGSTCTRRVQLALAEKGLEWELVPIDLMSGAHKKPEYLENLHPFGVIPVLEHDGFKVFESRAILRYIASLPGGNEIYGGSDLKARATIENWLEVESGYYNSPVSGIVAERLFKKMRGAEPDEAVVAEKIEAWKKVLDVYEKRLATQPYLAGSEVTIADLSHIPYTAYALDVGAGSVLDSYPNVKAWWERITSRPSWAKVSALRFGA